MPTLSLNCTSIYLVFELDKVDLKGGDLWVVFLSQGNLAVVIDHPDQR